MIGFEWKWEREWDVVWKVCAVAPPKDVLKTGVSTSINPLESKNERIYRIIWDLTKRISFDVWLTKRSRYLFLNLVSFLKIGY